MPKKEADERIATIQIIQDNKIIAKSSINGLKLIGIINRIPLDAFKAIGCNKVKDKPKFAQKEKDALLRIATAVQKVLDSKNPASAKMPLAALILGLKLVTSEKYVPASVDAISQSSAVAEIKLIIKSLDKK